MKNAMPSTEGHQTNVLGGQAVLPYACVCTCSNYPITRRETLKLACADAANHVASVIANRKRIELERRIVRSLIRHMKERGWQVFRTYDGEAWEYPRTEAEAIDHCFAVDEISLRFVPAAAMPHTPTDKAALRAYRKHGAQLEHGVLLTLGEGCDVINDYNFSEGDADGFAAAMEAHQGYDDWCEEYGRICEQQRAAKRALEA